MVGKLLKLHTKAHNEFLKGNHRASSRAILEHRSHHNAKLQTKGGVGYNFGSSVEWTSRINSVRVDQRKFYEHNYKFEKHPERVIRKKHFDIYSDVPDRIVTKPASLIVDLSSQGW